jgi:hypothetical protein
MGDTKLDKNYFICRVGDLAGTKEGELCQRYLDVCSGEPWYQPDDRSQSLKGYFLKAKDEVYYARTREACFKTARFLATDGLAVPQQSHGLLNQAYAICRGEDIAGTPAQERCQKFVDMCEAADGSDYSLIYDLGPEEDPRLGTAVAAEPFSIKSECLIHAKEFAKNGYLPDAHMRETRQKLLAGSDLALLVPEDCQGLKSYLSADPDKRVVDMIMMAGLDTFVSLSKEAGDRTGPLLRNLAGISHLISSEKTLLASAEALLDYIDAVRQTCSVKHINSQQPDRYADISIVSGRLESCFDIEDVTSDLAALARPYCTTFQLLSDPHDDFMRLAPAIAKYGPGPLKKILEKSGQGVLEWIARADAQAVVDRVGIDEIVRVIVKEGMDSIDLFNLFTNLDVRRFVHTYGVSPIVYLFKKSKKMHDLQASSYISNLFSAVGYSLRSENDIKRAGGEILELTSKLDYNDFYWFAQALKLFKKDLTSADVLIDVARRLVEYQEEMQCDAKTLLNMLKAAGASGKGDLDRGLLSLITDATKKSDDEDLHIALARMRSRSVGGFHTAIMMMDEYEEKHGRQVEEFAEIRFKCAFMVLHLLHKDDGSEQVIIGNDIPLDRSKFVETVSYQLEAVRTKYRGSKFASMATMMCEVLRDDKQSLELKTVSKGAGVTVKAFRGLDGISLVYVGKSEVPEVIPGKARVSNGKLVIPRFDGRYRVVFRRPRVTLPQNSDALLEAMRILPESMFADLDGFIFTGKQHEHVGEYGRGTVEVHRAFDKLGTIVHELGHHWDLRLSVNRSGRQGGFGDESQIYYDISWKGVDKKREIHGGKFGKVKLERDDFDKADFEREYGLCNPSEDIATMFEAYVADGPELRKRIREQMDEGNFELAAKYLFVRYVTPFAGREYGLTDDSLGYEEVIGRYDKSLDRTKTNHPHTYGTLMMIKAYYEDRSMNM